MRVRFHGAAGEVTGSMHLVEIGDGTATRRVLLDCGMMQGSQETEPANFGPFPFDPAELDAVAAAVILERWIAAPHTAQPVDAAPEP